ncbi:hypothetical protein N9M49_04080 [Flavicella sp.]|nr:hypothetical protein [Flavicella sp.]
MKTIKILMISIVFLSTTISVAQKTWSNNRYAFNNDESLSKLYLDINNSIENVVEFSVGSKIDRIDFHAPQFGFIGNLGVGVGVLDPKDRLVVSGNGRFKSSDDDYIKLGHSGSNSFIDFEGVGDLLIISKDGVKMTLTETGRLGVGTKNPTDLLDVFGHGRFSNSVSNYLQLGHTGKDSFIKFRGAGSLDFISNFGVEMTLTETGRLGVGTNNPNDVLDVFGHGRFSNSFSNYLKVGHQGDYSFIDFNGFGNLNFLSSNKVKMTLTETGSLGVGTESPTEKLEVVGNVKAAGINLEGDGAKTNTIDSNINGTIVFGGEDGSTLTNAQIADSFYPDFSVWVEEGIVAEDIAVAPSSEWDGSQPDYVFENDYELPSLEDVEAYLTSYKHLEGIPSKAEVAEKGWSLPSMDQKLLKKVEELTLYTIQQEKEIKALKALVDNLVETIKN